MLLTAGQLLSDKIDVQCYSCLQDVVLQSINFEQGICSIPHIQPQTPLIQPQNPIIQPQTTSPMPSDAFDIGSTRSAMGPLLAAP